MRNGRISFIFGAMVLGLLVVGSADRAAADRIDVWMQTPTAWENRTDKLGNDLIKQVVAPGGEAFIEVYAARGDNPGLAAIADHMERGMLARGGTYLQNRLSEQNHRTPDGAPALIRDYSGTYNGISLRALAVYTYGNGGAVAAFGVVAKASGPKYGELVYRSLASLRFSPPGTARGPAPMDFESLGCFKDQGAATGTQGRDLDGHVVNGPSMTVERCVAECSAKNFAYAGVQYGKWCFCGNAYGRSGPAANCTMPCAGNPSQICGGSWANNVYAVGNR